MSDPRIEAVVKELADDNDLTPARDTAKYVLAAADAVDPLRQKRTAITLDELEELPVGAIIADFGKGGTLMDSPVIACKTAHGDWQVMGGPPERRWRSTAVLEGAAGVPLTILSNPAA